MLNEAPARSPQKSLVLSRFDQEEISQEEISQEEMRDAGFLRRLETKITRSIDF